MQLPALRPAVFGVVCGTIFLAGAIPWFFTMSIDAPCYKPMFLGGIVSLVALFVLLLVIWKVLISPKASPRGRALLVLFMCFGFVWAAFTFAWFDNEGVVQGTAWSFFS